MLDVSDVSRPRPLVVAHRGASEEFPEHTLPAYRAAGRDGADGIECDVRLTADHHLVCVHDRRVDRTSDGTGVVSTLELARLEGLDWASWMSPRGDPEAPDADPERGHLLTLRRLLDTLVRAGEEQLTLIETKHPTRHGKDVEKVLVQVLRSFELGEGDVPGRLRVRVMSFSRRALRTMQEYAPRIPLVLLLESGMPSLTADGSLPPGVGAVGLPVKAVRKKPKLVRRFHRQGHHVYVYTVDLDEDVDRCLDAGVDVIITNRPRAVIDRLEVIR
jgi:glycerophosphoryl diester phosphodiesterase